MMGKVPSHSSAVLSKFLMLLCLLHRKYETSVLFFPSWHMTVSARGTEFCLWADRWGVFFADLRRIIIPCRCHITTQLQDNPGRGACLADSSTSSPLHTNCGRNLSLPSQWYEAESRWWALSLVSVYQPSWVMHRTRTFHEKKRKLCLMPVLGLAATRGRVELQLQSTLLFFFFFFLLNDSHPLHVAVSCGWAGVMDEDSRVGYCQLGSGGSLASPGHSSGAVLLAVKEHNWMALLELQLMGHFWLTLPLLAACLEASRLTGSPEHWQVKLSATSDLCCSLWIEAKLGLQRTVNSKWWTGYEK